MDYEQKALARKIVSRNVDLLALHFCLKPKTGYRLIGEIEKALNVRLSAGLVYGCLMRLERDELLSYRRIYGVRGRCGSFATTEKGRNCLWDAIQTTRSLISEVA